MALKFIVFLGCISLLFAADYTSSLFDFVGFVNPSDNFLALTIVRNQLGCFSACIGNDNCYFFDYCGNSSPTSCFLYDRSINSSDNTVYTKGPCQQYKLHKICENENTLPCRCEDNLGIERCLYKYDCNGNLVPLNTSSYTFVRTFSDGKSRELICNMTEDNGGWIVFQRRFDGSTDFYRNWTAYTNGFGDIDAEFYLGNQIIFEITKDDNVELRVDLVDKTGESGYAKYSYFSISGPEDFYRLYVNGYSGNAGDSLRYHSGQRFTTFDEDNDLLASNNCAGMYHGAWWYQSCHHSSLNGEYGNDGYGSGPNWYHWRGYYYALNSTRMMIRVRRY
ncbi:microfibril-associated glycoprotein 4-like [Crassostrea virginica]